jgi:hypothetical protein
MRTMLITSAITSFDNIVSNVNCPQIKQAFLSVCEVIARASLCSLMPRI